MPLLPLFCVCASIMAPAGAAISPRAFPTSVVRQAQAGERIVEIRIQGNYRTAEADVLLASGLHIGDPIDEETLAVVEQRLTRSGRFEQVEVRKRWRTIDSTEDVVLVIIVREVQGGSSSVAGRAARAITHPLVLPILEYVDGYGMTYGAHLSPVNLLGRRTHVAIPLTWGSVRQAAVEVNRPLVRGPFTRAMADLSIRRRHNPFAGEDDTRSTASAGVERAVGSGLKVGAAASVSDVRFGTLHERLTLWGPRVALDTRRNIDLPRNAAFIEGAWDHLNVGQRSVSRYRSDLRGYIGLPGSSSVMLRVAGTRATGTLPPYEQALLGGADSVRGFRTGSAAGDTSLLGSVEWRIPFNSPLSFGRSGVTLFADNGTAYTRAQALRAAKFHTGVGGGLFFSATVFRFNLDVARGLGNELRVHVSGGLQF